MKYKLSVKIHKTPEDWDSNDVTYLLDGKESGSGYQSKTDGTFKIQYCPNCHKENHAMSTSSGLCAWCGFDVNELSNERNI